MSRALLLAALLALPLALPLAAADHSFSHRIYVVGRVVDSEGKPAPGLPVELAFEGIAAGSGCFDSQPERTGPQGDYEICRHAHQIGPEARVIVRVGNLTRLVPIDPDLRHAVANLQLDEPARAVDINGQREFAGSVRVTGRSFVLLPAPVNEEGVEVNATPLPQRVVVTLRAGGEVVARGEDAPDVHGLYAVDVELAEIPEATLVHVTNGRELSEAPLSPLFRRADLNLVQDRRLLRDPDTERPGSDSPLPVWAALLALATAGAFARARRRR